MYEEYEYTLEECLGGVGKGWSDLIKRCYEACQITDPPTTIEQVKEKFGGLRFYVGATTEEVLNIINMCESQSYHICEECGNKGTLRKIGGGWVKTLCKECFSDLKARRLSRFK